jgi:hypothetical protein
MLVGGIFILWWLIRAAAYIKTPIRLHDEIYAHNWGFQLIVGSLYLVALVAFTAFVIAVERWLLDLLSRVRK